MRNKGLTLVAVLAAAVPGFAQIVSYEGNSFPEDEGWERRPRPHPPERWLSNGWIYFRAEVFDPKLCAGEDEYYRWELDGYAGANRFMLEWAVISDGPRSEIPDVAPSSCVAAGQRGIWFHTTVARDQASFLLDVRYPFWADLEPDVPHAFRLDIYGEHWYEWSVDGDVRAAGRPEGTYPTADSFIIWGARAACYDSTTAYDFVRFGIPDEPEVDCDAVRVLKATCRQRPNGINRIVARVRTRLDKGTELTLTNNGDHRPLLINARGRAKARYRDQSGEHTLLLLDCPAISQEVSCGP